MMTYSADERQLWAEQRSYTEQKKSKAEEVASTLSSRFIINHSCSWIILPEASEIQLRNCVKDEWTSIRDEFMFYACSSESITARKTSTREKKAQLQEEFRAY